MSVAKNLTIAAVTVLLALATLFSLERYGRGNRSFGSVGGLTDSRVPKFLVATPQDAYRIWKSAGASGRSVLFVSGRWEELEASETEVDPPMSRPYPLRLYRIARVLEQEHLSAANFLHVAGLNGIARRIVALLPERGYAEMRQAAGASKNGRITGDQVYLPRQGFPRWFTSAARFRGEDEPVLLYVSAAYFKEASPEELFRHLTSQGVRTDCIILCRGAGSADPAGPEQAGLNRFAALLGMVAPPLAGAGSGAAAPASGGS